MSACSPVPQSLTHAPTLFTATKLAAETKPRSWLRYINVRKTLAHHLIGLHFLLHIVLHFSTNAKRCRPIIFWPPFIEVLNSSSIINTPWVKKGVAPILKHSFVKCWPIFKNFSLLDSERNLQQKCCYISHRTLSVLLNYLEKLKFSVIFWSQVSQNCYQNPIFTELMNSCGLPWLLFPVSVNISRR